MRGPSLARKSSPPSPVRPNDLRSRHQTIACRWTGVRDRKSWPHVLCPEGRGETSPPAESPSAYPSRFASKRPGIVALPALDAGAGGELADDVADGDDVGRVAAEALVKFARQRELHGRDDGRRRYV